MFFLWIIGGLIFISILFASLSFKLEFENFVICFPKKESEKNNDKGKIKLKIYILRKLKIVSIDLKKIKSERVKFKQIQSLFNKYRDKGNSLNIKIKDVIKNLNITTEKVSIDIIVGVENAATTAIIVGFLYIILEKIIISRVKKIENQKCKISPSYKKEILFVKFNGIFEINVWNIINIIFKELKRRVNKNGRASNRATYVYSNE